jgi:hypothetical protein
MMICPCQDPGCCNQVCEPFAGVPRNLVDASNLSPASWGGGVPGALFVLAALLLDKHTSQ